jgi:hypothetical protein
MSLSENLWEVERSRERYWLNYPGTSPLRLRWRTLTVRRWLHVLPGEGILELGAGSGAWTEHLIDVLQGEDRITAVTFNRDLAKAGNRKSFPGSPAGDVGPLRNCLSRRLLPMNKQSPKGTSGTKLLLRTPWYCASIEQ